MIRVKTFYANNECFQWFENLQWFEFRVFMSTINVSMIWEISLWFELRLFMQIMNIFNDLRINNDSRKEFSCEQWMFLWFEKWAYDSRLFWGKSNDRPDLPPREASSESSAKEGKITTVWTNNIYWRNTSYFWR